MANCYSSTKLNIHLDPILKVMAEERGNSSRPYTSGSSPSRKVSEIQSVGHGRNRDGNMDSNRNPSKIPTHITSADFGKDTIKNQGRENDLSTNVWKYAKANNKEQLENWTQIQLLQLTLMQTLQNSCKRCRRNLHKFQPLKEEERHSTEDELWPHEF